MRSIFSRFMFAVLSICFATAASAALISAAPSPDGIRVTADPEMIRTRLQAFTAGGALAFDSGWKDGNVFDWSIQDNFGHALAYGDYRIVAMSSDVAGHVGVRGGTLHVQPEGAHIEGDELASDRAPAMVRLAHTGEGGQIVTTVGALSFRFGDFLASRDYEAMRLTPQGDLDVAGVIRAGKGIQFPDGTIQQTASIPSVMRLPGYVPSTNVAGSGTTNRIPKWTDASGTLGDSVMTEVGGKVGIGTTTPGGTLHLFGPATADVFAGMGPDVVLGPAMNYGYAGNSFGRGAGFFNVRPDASAAAPNPSLRFMTVNAQRMIITNTGNIGIGTTAPTQKLEVAGSLKLSGGGTLIFNDATSMSTAGATLGANTFTGNQSVTGNISATGSGTFSGNVSSNGAVSAGYEYDINGIRILSNAGAANLFAGISAGGNNTGAGNAFFGANAGADNAGGISNAFFGSSAGFSNVDASYNSYFGFEAGRNVNGGSNTFVGQNAGSGPIGSTASYNVAVGSIAGVSQSTAAGNTFVGVASGLYDNTGSNNTFVGFDSGLSNTSEDSNTFLGAGTNGAPGIENATAIGTSAVVTRSNSLVLGAIGTNVGIGTSSPTTTLFVQKDATGALGPRLTLKNGGGAAGAGTAIDFVTYDLLGNQPPARLQTIDDGVFSNHLVFLSKDPGAVDNALVERMRITSAGIVSINEPSPNTTSTNVKLHVNGKIDLEALGTAGGDPLCLNGNNIISLCSSSIRYKNDVADFAGGIDVIRRLQPVSYRWKVGGRKDLGFVAEEVEKVEPRLTIYNADGEVEGVRYERMTTMLVNAVKELADDRDRLKQENDELRVRLAGVERAIEKIAHGH